MIRSFVIALALFLTGGAFCVSARAADPAAKSANSRKPETALPFLGPGADKMTGAEYERVYKNYIQTSVLLGYPLFKETPAACDQALTAIFRGAGLFGYPVPVEAQAVQKTVKSVGDLHVETYEVAGVLLQVARGKNGALDRVVFLNSSSVKAMRRLSGFAKHELLALDRDPKTGLERVHGIPVGYQHPYLTKEGQGLYVKVLRFKGEGENCRPLEFEDNTWVGGYDLSSARCAELQTDAEKVWSEQLSPDDFSKRELDRMKAAALKAAMANGEKEAAAKALIEKHFTLPLTSEINVVGSAMRNLAQCNLLALGRAGGPAPKSGGTPAGGETTGPGDNGNGSGTAK